MLGIGPYDAKERRAKQKTTDELTHDRGLTEPKRRFAHQAADDEQKRQFGDEQRLRHRMRAAVGGRRWHRGAQSSEKKNRNAQMQQRDASAVRRSRSVTRAHRLICKQAQCLREITRKEAVRSSRRRNDVLLPLAAGE